MHNYSLAHSLTHSLTHSLSRSIKHIHGHSLAYMCMQWPFDRAGLENQCGVQPQRPPIPKHQAQCQIGNLTAEANTIRRAKPKSPPIRLPCFGTGWTFCYQDDQDPKQMSKVYWGVCDDDPECKKKHTDEPWLGYLSWQPHGAALARTSNRFEIYDKQDANCISASDDETSDGAE